MIAGNPLAGPCPYDVGDILQTANAANPSTRWPGTEWAAITTFLLGASAAHPAGETGGVEKHTLSENEMPTHNHSMQPDHYLVSWGTGAAKFGTIVSSTTWGASAGLYGEPMGRVRSRCLKPVCGRPGSNAYDRYWRRPTARQYAALHQYLHLAAHCLTPEGVAA